MAIPVLYLKIASKRPLRFTEPEDFAEGEGRNGAARLRESAQDMMWTLLNTIWPSYDEYATRTTRQIPVVVLEPLQARTSS